MECATIFYDKTHFFPMHLHPDRYTFSYILNGSANLICNNNIFFLKPGDLVIIPPYIAHQTLVEHFLHYKVIRIPKLYSFNSLNNDYLGLTIMEGNNSYKNHFDKWFDLIKSNDSEKMTVPYVFKQFLTNQNCKLTKQKVRLKKVLIHLENNFNRSIPIEELSSIAHLSGSHFQRLFKSNIGISPIRYLQNLRIEKAKEYIKAKNNMTDVAYNTGFFDQSHFNKYFKINVGMVPRRYADLFEND